MPININNNFELFTNSGKTLTITAPATLEEIEDLKKAVYAGKLSTITKLNVIGPIHTTPLRKFEELDERVEVERTLIKVMMMVFSEGQYQNLSSLQAINFDYIKMSDMFFGPILSAIQRNALTNLKSLDLGIGEVNTFFQLNIINAIPEHLPKLEYINVADSTIDDPEVVIKLLNLGPKVISKSSNVLHTEITNIYHYMSNDNTTIEEIQYRISQSLINAAHNGEERIVRYILNNSTKFPLIINKVYGKELIKHYQGNQMMQDIIFKAGFPPIGATAKKVTEDIKKAMNDPQNAHQKEVIEKRDYIIKDLEILPTEQVKALVGNFNNEVEDLSQYQDMLVSIINTDEGVRREYFAIPLKRSSPRQQSIFNKVIKGSHEEFIKYIVETSVHALKNLYFTSKNGAYSGHATTILKFFPNGENAASQEITIPQILAITKKNYLQREASLDQKKELLVTFCNKNPKAVDNNINEIIKILAKGNITAEFLSNRSKCYDLLNSLNEDTIDIIFKAITHQDINFVYYLQQLYKLAEYICSAFITNGDSHSACFVGFMDRVAFCIGDELEPGITSKYTLLLQEKNKFSDDIITYDNVVSRVSECASEIIEMMNQDDQLKTTFKDFLASELQDYDHDIPLAYNCVYQAINQSFLARFNRLPEYNEYLLVLDNVKGNHRLVAALFPEYFSKNIGELIRPLLPATSNDLLEKISKELSKLKLKYLKGADQDEVMDLLTKLYNGDEYITGKQFTSDMLSQANDLLLDIIQQLNIQTLDNESISKIIAVFQQNLLANPEVEPLIRANILINNNALKQKYLETMGGNEDTEKKEIYLKMVDENQENALNFIEPILYEAEEVINTNWFLNKNVAFLSKRTPNKEAPIKNGADMLMEELNIAIRADTVKEGLDITISKIACKDLVDKMFNRIESDAYFLEGMDLNVVDNLYEKIFLDNEIINDRPITLEMLYKCNKVFLEVLEEHKVEHIDRQSLGGILFSCKLKLLNDDEIDSLIKFNIIIADTKLKEEYFQKFGLTNETDLNIAYKNFIDEVVDNFNNIEPLLYDHNNPNLTSLSLLTEGNEVQVLGNAEAI